MKGGAGADYGIPFSLATAAGKGGITVAPGDPSWDIWVNQLPFMLASSTDRPYTRETVPIRRDRIDQAREPGESSLDSNLWLRSQTSWHNGAGQAVAEPLEDPPEVARFRFHDSHGIDPWTVGELRLLGQQVAHTAGGAASTAGTLRACVGTPYGVLTAGTTGVKMHSSEAVPTLYSSVTTATKLTANEDQWFGLSGSNIIYGPIATSGATTLTAVAGGTALNWCKDRLWFGAGAALYEVPGPFPVGGTTLPAVFHTFRSGVIVDIESAAGGVYVMVRVGSGTSVYVVTAQDTGTLNPPREVAQLPHGEDGLFLASYLGQFMVVGTTRGVRVAACSDAYNNPTLTVGPLSIEDSSGSVVDAVGCDRFMYITGRTFDGNGWCPGMYRLDLSRPLSGSATNPGRFAWCRDAFSPVGSTPLALAVADGSVWGVYGASGAATLVYPTTTPVASAWVTSGQVTFSTAERKAWLSMTTDIDGAGTFTLEADSGAGWGTVTSSAVAAPFDGDIDIDTTAHAASPWLEWRLTLTPSGATGPTVASVGLRATGSPKRNRYYRIPLMCMDSEVDRNAVPVGYAGFAADRLAELEALEAAGGLLRITDTRTGQAIRAQVERVTFESVTTPTRGFDNFGGIVTLTVMAV